MLSKNTQQESGQGQYVQPSSEPKLALGSFWPRLEDILNITSFATFYLL